MMLSEKYRPTSIDECVLSHLDPFEEDFLRRSVKSDTLPNLLLFGPPGTGKTTIARILCNDDKYSVHTYNGSLLGKAGVERFEKLIWTKSLFHEHRCILIDEVDGITDEGQKALRAMIEQMPDRISWIFTANNYEAIIKPIRSRLKCINVSVPSTDRLRQHADKTVDRCLSILKREGVSGINPDEVSTPE